MAAWCSCLRRVCARCVLPELTGIPERIDLMQDAFLIGLPPEHRLAGASTPVSLTELAEDDWIVASTEGFLVRVCPAREPVDNAEPHGVDKGRAGEVERDQVEIGCSHDPISGRLDGERRGHLKLAVYRRRG
jgi:hypothetical protein